MLNSTSEMTAKSGEKIRKRVNVQFNGKLNITEIHLF